MPGGRPRKQEAPKRRRRGTGSVGTRADGRIFAVRPSDLDPLRRPVYGPGSRQAFTSEAEATAWLNAELVRRQTPTPSSASTSEPLVAYLARWHADSAPLMPSRTARAYKRSLALWVPLVGMVPLGQLTHEVIRGALRKLTEATWQRQREDGTPTSEPQPYSRRTIAQARMVLGYALADLVPDVLPSNPVRRVRLPREQAPEQPVWDGAEAERFLEAAERLEPDLALAYRLILRRGLRRGECLSLQWKDLDERRAVLTIASTAGDRAGEVGDTKGRRSREIPLSSDLLTRLQEHREKFGRIQKDSGKIGTLSPWMFANPETGLCWSHQRLNRRAPAICAAADVPVIMPKDMRATCATNLLSEGRPLPEVSHLLGHSSIAVTSQFYERIIKRRQEHVARIADEIDAALDRSADAARGDTPAPIRRAEG